MTFDWQPLIDNMIPPKLSDDKEIGESERMVRNIILDWINERFFPEYANLTVFDKCIRLFNQQLLHDIAEDYYIKISSGERHWIELLYSILEEVSFNYGKDELKEVLSQYDIEPQDFLNRLTCVSGFIQQLKQEFRPGNKIDNVPELIDEKLERLGSFYGIPYACETYNIVQQLRFYKDGFNKDTIKQNVIDILDSRDLPELYDDYVVFDRCYMEEEEGTLFGFKVQKRATKLATPEKGLININ